MEFKIENKHEYSWLSVLVPKGQKIFVEAGSMATMSTNMIMKALFKGGLRRFISNESLFISEFKADGFDGEISIAPGPSGDVGHFRLENNRVYLASSSFLAHSEGVSYKTKFQKLSQGLLSGAGWFLIEMSGTGDVWFNTYGALIEVDLNNEELTIDNGHIVAFTEGVEYDIVRLGGYKSLFFSGEGFVCKFRGQGKVFFQTKKPAALINWANSFRPVQQTNS